MAKSPIMSKLFILIFVPALLLGQPGREIVLFGTVQGQVDESETIPLAFVQIDVISGTAFHAQDMTDGSGYYEFSATWGEDDWPFFHSAQVSASPDGYISQEQTVDFSSWPVELNFVLLPDENPTPYGWITGTVTAQLSETGPVLLYPGAVITAEPGWAGPDNVTGFTDDLGAFELELQASELPWTIICSTAFGDQEFEVLIDPDSGMIQNFHFNAWEYPTLPPAQNLSATLSEDETMTFLSWDTQEEWPGICDANFTVLANVMNDPSEDWFVIGETEDLEFIHIIDLPDEFPIDICYRVHTFCGVLEALPSLVDCVQNYEIPFPPAPYGLSAFYDPGQGLGGAAVLSWLYPELPDPEMIPIFNVYANLGSWSGYEFIFIEQTDEQTYVYQFGDFAEPDNENCFRITAQIDEQESEPCSSQCVYLEEEPTGEGHFY
ncbi:MAG: hypothetical protein H8D46_00555, partial [FCB group bacterium]|nr:hypothetical protein [FCB group bacterium]